MIYELDDISSIKNMNFLFRLSLGLFIFLLGLTPLLIITVAGIWSINPILTKDSAIMSFLGYGGVFLLLFDLFLIPVWVCSADQPEESFEQLQV